MIDAFDILEDQTIRNEFYQAFEKLDRIDLIQLLSDLKYIPLKAFDDLHIDDSELAKAISRFRSEYQAALQLKSFSNLDDIRKASEALEFEEPTSVALTKKETYILKELVGLNNELIIHQVVEGECTLLSRVLLYRYRVYDINKGVMANQKVTGAVIQKLEASAKKIGFNDGLIELGNLLASQEGLSTFCLSSSVLSNNIFGHCIFIELPSKQGKEVIRSLGAKIRKKRRFIKALSAEGAKTTINRLSKHEDFGTLHNEIHRFMGFLPNKFMRRTLQVKLWTMGLYQGNLDHDFGPLSTNALVEYLMTITEDDNTGKEALGLNIFNFGNDQCAISIRQLLTHHFLPVETAAIAQDQSSVSQIFDFVLEDKSRVTSLSRNEKKRVHKESQKLKKNIEIKLRVESRTIINGASPKKARQYKAKKGIMKFFSNLFKFVKNAFTKLLKLIKKLFRLIKKTIKIIYSEIKEAFQHFKDGLTFLFGKRIISTNTSITTDYDFDFDGITKIHSVPTTQELQDHAATVRNYAAAIYPTLNFIRIVIKWGIHIATGPIGWLKILISIAKLFKEMLRKQILVKLA